MTPPAAAGAGGFVQLGIAEGNWEQPLGHSSRVSCSAPYELWGRAGARGDEPGWALAGNVPSSWARKGVPHPARGEVAGSGET